MHVIVIIRYLSAVAVVTDIEIIVKVVRNIKTIRFGSTVLIGFNLFLYERGLDF